MHSFDKPPLQQIGHEKSERPEGGRGIDTLLDCDTRSFHALYNNRNLGHRNFLPDVGGGLGPDTARLCTRTDFRPGTELYGWLHAQLAPQLHDPALFTKCLSTAELWVNSAWEED